MPDFPVKNLRFHWPRGRWLTTHSAFRLLLTKPWETIFWFCYIKSLFEVELLIERALKPFSYSGPTYLVWVLIATLSFCVLTSSISPPIYVSSLGCKYPVPNSNCQTIKRTYWLIKWKACSNVGFRYGVIRTLLSVILLLLDCRFLTLQILSPILHQTVFLLWHFMLILFHSSLSLS